MARTTRQPAALADLRFSVVGAGSVAISLASWARAGGAEAAVVAGRPGSEPARQLAAHLGCPAVGVDELSSAGQDLLLVAVADPALSTVAETLARRPQAAVALHTSGSRSAAALSALAAGGSAVGSLHPLKAFSRPLPDPTDATGVWFGVDGDREALEMARRLTEAWDAHAVEIPAEGRLLYHFAATLAAGGVVTLLATAADLLTRSGLPREALAGLHDLAHGAIDGSAAAEDPATAITGPTARGDGETVLAQLEAARKVAPESYPVLLALARETLRQCGRVGVGEAGTAAARRALGEELERLEG